MDKLTIDIMQAATQEDCALIKKSIQQSYPDLDFTCLIDDRHGGYGILVNILQTPAGMSQSDAQKIAESGFLIDIEGPWEFSITLPQ